MIETSKILFFITFIFFASLVENNLNCDIVIEIIKPLTCSYNSDISYLLWNIQWLLSILLFFSSFFFLLLCILCFHLRIIWNNWLHQNMWLLIYFLVYLESFVLLFYPLPLFRCLCVFRISGLVAWRRRCCPSIGTGAGSSGGSSRLWIRP